MSYTGYAIVEVMGHRRHVGLVEEEIQYGVVGIRIKVPDGDVVDRWKSEHWYPGTALFGVEPCSEHAARTENKSWDEDMPRLPVGGTDEDDDIDENTWTPVPKVGEVHGSPQCPGYDDNADVCQHCAGFGGPGAPDVFKHCWEKVHATIRADGDETPEHPAEAQGLGVYWKCRHCDAYATLAEGDEDA